MQTQIHTDGAPGYEVMVLSPEEWIAAQLGYRGTSMASVASDIEAWVNGATGDTNERSH